MIFPKSRSWLSSRAGISPGLSDARFRLLLPQQFDPQEVPGTVKDTTDTCSLDQGWKDRRGLVIEPRNHPHSSVGTGSEEILRVSGDGLKVFLLRYLARPLFKDCAQGF